MTSDAIDAVMGALASRTRHAGIVALLGAATETGLYSPEARLDREDDRTRLSHVHLPKPAHFGYVDWDAEAATVSKSPRFAEAEPLVGLLDEYEPTAPG